MLLGVYLASANPTRHTRHVKAKLQEYESAGF